jgi:hypothetical protein
MPNSAADGEIMKIVSCVRRLRELYSQFSRFQAFERHYGEKVIPGTRSKANFYKCGDETEFEHYGAWSPVDLPTPDFHVPRFFGDIHFE